MRATMLTFFVLIPLIAGCQSPVSKAIDYYQMTADEIQIGDSKEKVLATLGPANEMQSASQRKRPEIFVKDGKTIEIHYFRSSVQNYDIRTDDEFTPYVFEDGKLVAIGWSYLGGPKTQAQPRPQQDIQIHHGWGWYTR